MSDKSPYPPIAEYGYIADCHSAALVSRSGSIDWCCLPRFESASCFGRLLDWSKGGYCQMVPSSAYEVSRRYCSYSLSAGQPGEVHNPLNGAEEARHEHSG